MLEFHANKCQIQYVTETHSSLTISSHDSSARMVDVNASVWDGPIHVIRGRPHARVVDRLPHRVRSSVDAQSLRCIHRDVQ